MILQMKGIEKSFIHKTRGNIQVLKGISLEVDSGEVVAMHLIYSGSHIARCEQDEWGHVRAQIGINPNAFNWTLEPGETIKYVPRAAIEDQRVRDLAYS